VSVRGKDRERTIEDVLGAARVRVGGYEDLDLVAARERLARDLDDDPSREADPPSRDADTELPRHVRAARQLAVTDVLVLSSPKAAGRLGRLVRRRPRTAARSPRRTPDGSNVVLRPTNRNMPASSNRPNNTVVGFRMPPATAPTIASVVSRNRNFFHRRSPGRYRCLAALIIKPSIPAGAQSRIHRRANARSVVEGHNAHGGPRACSANNSSRAARRAVYGNEVKSRSPKRSRSNAKVNEFVDSRARTRRNPTAREQVDAMREWVRCYSSDIRGVEAGARPDTRTA
jgi:hypothetical protein